MYKAVILLIFFSFGFSNIIIYKGKTFNKYYAYNSLNIRPSDNKPVTLLISKYVGSDTGPFNRQVITNYKIIFNSHPIKRTNYIDQYSNYIEEITFKPTKYHGKYTTISYEIEFNIFLSSLIYQLDSISSFPLKKQYLSNIHQAYLKENDSVIFVNNKVQRKAIQLTLNTTNCVEAIQNITLWIKNKIYEETISNTALRTHSLITDYAKNKKNNNSLNIIKRKSGNYSEKLTLLIAMLRSLGIPARYVSGLPLDQSFVIADKNKKIRKYIPKGEFLWIEAYLSDLGWIPINLRESAFVLFPSYIKHRVGPTIASLYTADFKKNKIVGGDYYFEKLETKFDTNWFRISQVITNKHLFFYLPPINTNTFVNLISNNYIYPVTPSLSQHADLLLDSHRINDIKLINDPNATHYAQQIDVPKEITISNISLSLSQLLNNGGSIYLELYKISNSIITLTATSKKIHLGNFYSLATFNWYKFKFINNKEPLIITPGKYMIIPKITGNSIIHWSFISEQSLCGKKESYTINTDNSICEYLSGNFSSAINYTKRIIK